MFTGNRILLLDVIKVVACALILSTNVESSVIDQQNPGPGDGSQGGVVFGQSFVPAFTELNEFTVEIGNFNAVVAVQILNGLEGSDGLEGPVLGESNPVTMNGFGRFPTEFIFSDPIDLIPGQEYVAKIFALSGPSAPTIDGISITLENQYADGQLLEGGVSSSTPYLTQYDAIFNEGIDTPEVSASRQCLLGLIIVMCSVCWLSRRSASSGQRLP
jgi:hypothetical protein